MFLCGVSKVEAGVVMGEVVMHPRRPDVELLPHDQVLDPCLIRRFGEIGVEPIWANRNATADFELIMSLQFSKSR